MVLGHPWVIVCFKNANSYHLLEWLFQVGLSCYVLHLVGWLSDIDVVGSLIVSF